ncbi:hypothetical protein ACFXKS_03280 [Streptomyces scopuliridis]|uniref:hypothetical protein n=1 Tax=Streptomyces scopuliridis TaxID=452529 RepID=UPI0036965930
MSTDIAQLASRVAALERLLARTTRTARLAYSSIEGGAIDVHDDDGSLTGVIGVQPDGTTGVVAVNGPRPPTPTAPLVTAGISSLKVVWDGRFIDAQAAPLDLARVQVHLLDNEDSVPDVRNPTATIEAASGASVTVAIGVYRTVWVRLVAVTTSGTPGSSSPGVSAVPRRASGDDLADGAVALPHLSGPLADSVAQGFVDTFATVDSWEIISRGTGASWGVVSSPDALSGGRVGQATGSVSLGGRVRIPYEPQTLYRVAVRVRTTVQADVPDVVYLGLLGYAGDGVTLVNREGAASTLIHNYCAAAGPSVPASAGWVTYTGYVRGRTAPGTSGPNRDLRAPGAMHSAVRYVSPYVRLNYNNTPGVMQVDWVSVTAVQTGLVTFEHLAAGAVRAENLDADAINGKVVTGALIQTAATGRRVVLNPSPTVSTRAALEFYSGSSAETEPGGISSDVIDMGTWRQPEVSVWSPLVGGQGARMLLRSAELGGRGRVSLEPSSQSDGYAHVTIRNGGPSDDSEITIYGARGSSLGGGFHSQVIAGAGITWHSGNRQMTLGGGVLNAPNIATGTVRIAPTPNTPTSVTVTGLNVAGATHRAFVTANSAGPGTAVLGVGASSVSGAGLTIWLTRTSSAETSVWWMIVGS